MVIIATEESATTGVSSAHGGYVGLYIHCSLVQQFIKHIPGGRFQNNLAFPIDSELRTDLSNRLSSLLDNPLDDFESEVCDIVRRLWSEIENKHDEFKGDIQKRYVDAAIQRIVRDLAENEKTKVQDLAEAAACSQRTLQYAFKRHLNVTPKKFLDLLRLTSLRRQINFTNCTDSDSAYDFGYTNASRAKKQLREYFREP
jgi:AraC-like DNA-binding protein